MCGNASSIKLGDAVAVKFNGNFGMGSLGGKFGTFQGFGQQTDNKAQYERHAIASSHPFGPKDEAVRNGMIFVRLLSEQLNPTSQYVPIDAQDAVLTQWPVSV